jgi:mRNA-degrading endonuclease RelE of RelBE toxin-antitoxin system
MKLRFTNQFEKQLDKISDKRIRQQIAKALQELND